MIGICLVLLIRVTRPLRRLSKAAELFGRQPEHTEPLPETGPREVREAACSFNRMRERICGNLAARDRMLAAMAHDLRTPLTRLQLNVERVKDSALQNRLQNNIDDISGIISQSLDLTRSLDTEEAPTRIELSSFVQSIVDDNAETGTQVSMSQAEEDLSPIIVRVRRLCLKRCLENLISNACKYGGGARVTLTRDHARCTIRVLDEGPGIPEPLLDSVFEPFFRLEPSRNKALGGTGLGLTIARNMALLNNAELTLANRPEDGLEARLSLPCEEDN